MRAWRHGLKPLMPLISLYLLVSSITLMELELGILSFERRDALQGAVLRSWFEQHVLPEFSGRTLAIDTAVALRRLRPAACPG